MRGGAQCLLPATDDTPTTADGATRVTDLQMT